MPNLLTSLSIRDLELKNRIVLPPMATERATEEGEVTPEVVEHYRRYADAGVGLIITEHAFIAPQGKNSPRQISVAEDRMIPGLKRLADAIHAAGGVAGVQINHCGMAGKPELVGQPVGPSALRHPRREEGEPARELGVEEIRGLVHAYAEAARRVQAAGFDMVEIHSAHGYLINQFNSPLSNKRTDSYGGSLEKRFRFGLEVIAAVRQAVGSDYPVFFRLGADDLIEGGLSLAESKQAAPWLVEAGVDVLDISGGFGGYRGPEGVQGYLAYLTEGLKEVVQVPLITTGGVLDAEAANRIITSGQADLVGVGRAMLKDYDWARTAIAVLSANH